MIRFNFNIRIPIIEEKRFIGALEEIVEFAVTKGARAFLVAAVPRVPIYTGFARGAFRNLEDLFGRVERSRNGARIRGTLRGSSVKTVAVRGRDRPRYYKGTLKTQDSGRKFATPPSGIITKVKDRVGASFRFAINIDYFDKLDREKWHSFEEGIKAFNKTVQLILKNNQFDPASFVTRKQFT
jgi:hypothetical protein